MRINNLSQEAQRIIPNLSEEVREKFDGDGTDNTEFGKFAASIALAWIAQGGSEESFIEAVSASHLGETYYRPNRLEGQLAGRFAWAEEHYDPSYSTGGLKDQLAALRGRLEGSDLHPGLRASAVAVVDHAMSVGAGGTWTPDVSIRDLVELAGVSQMAASRHIKKFQEIGLVTRLERRGKGKRRRLHLDLDYEPPMKVADTKVVTSGTYNMEVHICTISDHLVWSAHGVGQTAYRVWTGLSPAPGSVAEVIKATGLVRNTVTRHLAKLVEVGLVVEIPGKRKRYAVNLAADLDHAAEAAGAYASQRKRQEQVQKDREEHTEYRETHPDAPLGVDVPVEKRPQIEGALQDNPWCSDVSDLYREHQYRINAEGLELMRATEYDDLLGWDPMHPPEEFREYRYRPRAKHYFAGDPFKDLDQDPEPAPAAMTVMDFMGEPDF